MKFFLYTWLVIIIIIIITIITSSGDIRTTNYSRFKSMIMRIIMWTLKLLDAESCTA